MGHWLWWGAVGSAFGAGLWAGKWLTLAQVARLIDAGVLAWTGKVRP